MLPIYLVWNLFVILIEVISISISNYKLSEKLTNRLYRLGILISLVVSMLYTETADQFQLLATLISFCLIFQFLIPNDFQNLLVDIKRNAHQKRAKHKNKKENQQQIKHLVTSLGWLFYFARSPLLPSQYSFLYIFFKKISANFSIRN